jgi:hypothetical protein
MKEDTKEAILAIYILFGTVISLLMLIGNIDMESETNFYSKMPSDLVSWALIHPVISIIVLLLLLEGWYIFYQYINRYKIQGRSNDNTQKCKAFFSIIPTIGLLKICYHLIQIIIKNYNTSFMVLIYIIFILFILISIYLGFKLLFSLNYMLREKVLTKIWKSNDESVEDYRKREVKENKKKINNYNKKLLETDKSSRGKNIKKKKNTKKIKKIKSKFFREVISRRDL